MAAAGLAGAIALTGGTATQAATGPQRAPEVQVATQIGQMDATFLKTSHQGNLFEFVLGRMATERGRSAAVRCLGHLFVRDHHNLDQKLVVVATRERLALPHTLSRAQRAIISDLVRRTRADFDRAWVRTQITIQRQTVRLIHQELRFGRSAEVKQVAREALPTVHKHLALLHHGLQQACAQ
ncbi:DUF4142 domain-containing protein [Allokutzneria albata]|uniref:DUF4142 domain-containing protein n=1 Tax=Allokutzneria albata TaxID=211114 RepID=UPI001E3B423A|nr:DUF4142 domain-containing protein [Allokutzneria albata]